MPEGLDVRAMADQIEHKLIGRAITQVKIVGGHFVKDPPPGFEEFQKAANARALTVHSIDCHGKFMYWTLDKDWTIWFTLDSTNSFTNNKKTPHVTIRWSHVNPYDERKLTRLLLLTDPQNVGSISFINDPQALEDKLLNLSKPAIQV